MELMHAMLPAMAARALLLAELLAFGAFAGELLSVFLLSPLITRLHRFTAALRRRLDRPQRSAATLVYRGIIALIVLMLPALLLGMALTQPSLPAQMLLYALMIGFFGHGFALFALLRALRALRQPTPSLMSDGIAFADIHGVVRQQIWLSAQRFALIIGSGFWFVLLGPVAMLCYLALAGAALHFGQGAFGWAARECFRLIDLIPGGVTRLLLGLAGVFIPRTAPFKAWGQWDYRACVATLLRISLGGNFYTPAGPQTYDWVGDGTAKAEPSHLLTWLAVRLVATLIAVIWLLAPEAWPMIFHI